MDLIKYGFSAAESSLVKRLKTPEKIQRFIDNNLIYDPERENRSVLDVIRDRKAECFNGALFAFTCLLYHGYECTIIELSARRDEEHMLAVFKKDGNYGSIAKSKFLGLKFRHPIYQSLRDLAVSYMEFYIAFDGRYSLQSYSQWKDFTKYKFRYLNNSYVVNRIAFDLHKSKHINLINHNTLEYLADPKRYWCEVDTIPPGIKIPKKYLKIDNRRRLLNR